MKKSVDESISYQGIRIIEMWSVPSGLFFETKHNNTIYMNPEDGMKLCIATKKFDAALDRLKKVIHYKIDNGYYDRRPTEQVH